MLFRSATFWCPSASSAWRIAATRPSIMLDDALEPVGPPPLDPVHHIAAVGAARGAGIGAIELRVARGGEGKALLQVFEWPPAPILVNRVGEGLAVALAAMETTSSGLSWRPLARTYAWTSSGRTPWIAKDTRLSAVRLRNSGPIAAICRT